MQPLTGPKVLSLTELCKSPRTLPQILSLLNLRFRFHQKVSELRRTSYLTNLGVKLNKNATPRMKMHEGSDGGSKIVLEGKNGKTNRNPNQEKVGLLPLAFVIFYEVSGGPFGIEDTVKAGGPLLAVVAFLSSPFYGAFQKPW
eukprot:TRINITY_DN29416_c0_g1_i1.p1 TRINITY_DN29416_c0_g1~~TRINITY_DN29416_c0_g1_i1.p1  ORF type:complete len:143 (+),score=14.43 TRINITY_DN29416_c0_g1_i1:146-574(+)